MPSLNVDTNSLPTPTRGRRRRREPSPSPPLSPASSTPINAHALIHTLHTSYLPLPLPPPHDQPYFCALMNSLSIRDNNPSLNARTQHMAPTVTKGLHGSSDIPSSIIVKHRPTAFLTSPLPYGTDGMSSHQLTQSLSTDGITSAFVANT